MMPKRPLRGYTNVRRDLLFVLAANGGESGAELRRTLEQVQGQQISETAIYGILDDFHDEGLVDKRRPNDRRKAFRLTKDGRRLLEDDLEWQREQL